MTLRELLAAKTPVLLDGAMGTFLAQRGFADDACEWATLRTPELLAAVHAEYIAAGAHVLRTNTFAADTRTLDAPRETVRELFLRAVEIARRAAGDQAAVALSLGPMLNWDDAEAALDERLWLLEQCAAAGVDTYWFETYADLALLKAHAGFVRQRLPAATIMASFSCSADGYTRSGQAIARVLDELLRDNLADLAGINCGLGPAHIVGLLRALPWAEQTLPLALLPNAGYPVEEDGRTRFSTAPLYFAETLAPAVPLGARLLGGCCGTTPAHIRALGSALKLAAERPLEKPVPQSPAKSKAAPKPVVSPLAQKLAAKRFITLAELDPPKHADLTSFTAAAYKLQLAGIDALTVPDSPLACARMSSVLCGAQVKHALGIETIPHLCCRDRNINALHGDLLGAHAAGLRAVLAVTGDAIPESEHSLVKPVFNLSSTGLVAQISRLNRDFFPAEPFAIGVAFQPGARNPEAELKRLREKQAQGASFVMTQPVFDPAALPVLDEARAMGLQVLVGIMPLVSYRNAQYMHNEVPGIRIPQHYLQRFDPAQNRAEGERIGLDIAAEIAALARPHADGFYIMTPFGRAELVCAFLARLRAEAILK